MILISVLLITHFVFSVCYDRNVQSEILLPFIMIINQACKKNQYKKITAPSPDAKCLQTDFKTVEMVLL